MLTYETAKTLVFASGTVPDGYFGRRAHAAFAYDPRSGKTLVVTDCGFHTSLLPQAVDIDEARWLLVNHPIAKELYRITA
ncbi:MAG TPA: hypothetical protein VLA24_10715 [Pseudomonadales bacterium]|nr:hypothetical protein [Pseudomonadales bacterium]